MQDITNEKYGHLTVIGRVSRAGGWWLAKCDCGNVKEVRGKYLRCGRVKTCGKCELGRRLMATSGRIKAKGEKAVSMLYNRHVRNQMERGSSYVTEYDIYAQKIRQNCTFCGRDPLQRKKGPRIPYHELINTSTSRVVTNDDWVSCCNKCRRWIGQGNYMDFLEHVYKIVQNIERSK